MIILNIEQRSEAWHEARCGRVTGTRFASLMAGESTKAYKDLVSDIVCEIITGKIEDGYVSPAMEHGIETEPEARREYESVFGTEIKTAGFIIPDEETKYHDWVGISPDGLTSDNGVLEIKCPMAKTHLGYIESDKLPTDYKYQVQGQLFVTGFDYCDFMSYVEDMKPFIIRVYPDKEIHAEFERRLDLLITQVNDKKEVYNKYNYL